MTKKSGRGGFRNNPRSLENLVHEGRPRLYEQAKKRHGITLTDDGWEGFQELASTVQLKGQSKLSASELVESFGRRAIDLRRPVKHLLDPETLARLDMTTAEALEMPLLDLLVQIASLTEP
jgi:hypothetical protein